MKSKPSNEKESYAHKLAKEILYKKITTDGVAFITDEYSGKYDDIDLGKSLITVEPRSFCQGKSIRVDYGWVMEFPVLKDLDTSACYPDEVGCLVRQEGTCPHLNEFVDRFRDKDGYSPCKGCSELEFSPCEYFIPDIAGLHEGSVVCVIEITHKHSAIDKYFAYKDWWNTTFVEVRTQCILSKVIESGWAFVRAERIVKGMG